MFYAICTYIMEDYDTTVLVEVKINYCRRIELILKYCYPIYILVSPCPTHLIKQLIFFLIIKVETNDCFTLLFAECSLCI